MIDVILSIMALAMGRWYRERGITSVHELMTLVPVNLRPPEQWSDGGGVGNRATGILVPLPITLGDALATYGEVRARMLAKKEDPGSHAAPSITEMLSALPRGLMTCMVESTFFGSKWAYIGIELMFF